MAAVGICTDKLVEKDTKGKNITVCTDSRATLLALSREDTNSHLVRSVVETLNNLAGQNKVKII